MQKKHYTLRRGNQVLVFRPSELLVQWFEYKGGEWVCSYKQKKDGMYFLRNIWSHYIRKGFRPSK